MTNRDITEAAVTRKLARTYYRSLTSDGRLWCESRDRKEVERMSEGKGCTFEKLEVYEVTEGWVPRVL